MITAIIIIIKLKLRSKKGKKYMQGKQKTMYDLMRESEFKEEDASFPEEWMDEQKLTEKEKYFDFYDDIKLTPKDDW